MGGRSLKLFRILLLCVFLGSCSRRSLEKSDELITQDNDINIYDQILNEDIDMAEHEVLQEENVFAMDERQEEDNEMSANEEVQDKNDMPINEELLDEKAMSVNEELQEYKEMVADDEVLAHILDLTAGSVINTNDFTKEMIGSFFYIEELNQEIIDRITGKSYKEDADIPYSDLRYVRLLHRGFDGLTYVGEMIVNKAIADDVLEIFKELYEIEYPIEKILLIDDYDADDLLSMADNNSSAFNYRLVEGTNRRSVHSDGLAIDINPLYNPYVRTRDGKLEVLPESGAAYVDRDKDNDYYIRKDDPCYKAFISRGFTWGGEWKNSKDYQHFEKKSSD